MKLSRRELAVAAAGVALVTRAAAQTPDTAIDQAKAAQEATRLAAEALSKFEIPMATEPAFRFIP